MPSFYTSMTDPSTSEVGLSCDGVSVTIQDWSNYIASTESGHLVSSFYYKKIEITNPDGTTYIFSTDGTGDALINAPETYINPALYPPIETTYAYSTLNDRQDGVYVIRILTLPQWDGFSTYQEYDTVLRSGVIYQALQTSSNKDPLTETTYWSLITDDTLVLEKYNLTERISVTNGIEECLANLTIQAIGSDITSICDSEQYCESKAFQSAQALDMIIEAADNLLQSEDWEKIADLINSGVQICNCCN